MKKFPPSQKEKQVLIWDFNLDEVEKDVDSIIDKYRRKDVSPNTTITTKVEELPKKGFFLVLMSRRDDKLTVRQFGHDMDTVTIEEGFLRVLNSIYLPKKNEKIGIA